MAGPIHVLTFRAAAAMIVLAAGASASAQGVGTDSAAACRKAASLVRAYDESVINSGGHATQGAGKKEERQVAAAHLMTCGANGGIEAAMTLTSTRTLTDTATLSELVGPFRNFRDTAVLNAAMTIADDGSASVPARIFALRTLWVLRTGKIWVGYEQLLPTDEATVSAPTALCESGRRFTDATPYWVDGVVPPAGFETQILTLAERLRADASQPLAVRAAATCVLRP